MRYALVSEDARKYRFAGPHAATGNLPKWKGNGCTVPQTDKAGSWQWMIGFYEGLFVLPHWQRLAPLLDFVRLFAVSDDASRFRAGQSLDALIISTTVQHGLEGSDPHIVVQAEHNSGLLLLQYWCGREQNDVLKSFTCEANEMPEKIKPLLDRLWHDTLGKEGRANRSSSQNQATQSVTQEKTARTAHLGETRLARECANLDPAEEQAFTNEG